MAKFGPVCPAQIARGLKDNQCLGDYHLLLAHDVVKHPVEYALLYRDFGMTIIMDNGVAELGKSVDLEMIKDAITIVPSTTVVLPDVYLDSAGTIRDCRAAAEEWPAKLGTGTWFMYVPQGKTIQEWTRCAEALCGYGAINFWGIPRNIVDWIGTRRDLIQIANALDPNRKIHLLGFSNDVIDDVICARNPLVAGIDSAVPLRLPAAGIKYEMALGDLPKRGDWFDSAKWDPQIADNVRKTRQWVRNGKV